MTPRAPGGASGRRGRKPAPAGRVRIGISGWTYAGWRHRFYPEGLAHRRELEYASSKLETIEINGSFYSLQLPTSYARWYDETPADFVFAIKGSRFITHMKKLRDVETPLANFLASGVLRLREKLGPFLWQFPAQQKFDLDRFKSFLQLLPRTTEEAAEMARGHDARLDDRAWTHSELSAPLRHCFEVRHPSFLVPEFIALLREYNAAFVYADTAGLWAYTEDVTADFVYIRLHGAEELYTSGYTDEQLEWWAARIRAWSCGSQPTDAVLASQIPPSNADSRDVYVYFDNDAKVHAPFDALRLVELLG